MKTFKYKAKKGPGEMLEGTLFAETRDEAVDKINEMGLLPVDVREEAGSKPVPQKDSSAPRYKKVKSHELAVFYRQMARLVKAGVPILRVLGIVTEQTENASFRQVLSRIHNDIREGQALSKSLSVYPYIFSPFDIALIEAGESVGHLDESLNRIAEYREEQESIRSKVRGALAYPAFVLSMGFCTVVFMLSYVIPKFARFFTDLGQELPLPTRMLIAMSQWSQKYWYIVFIVIAAVVFFFRKALQSRSEKLRWDRLLLRLPKLGPLLLKLQVARLCRTLELLLRSEIPILNAMRIAIPVLDNEAIKVQLDLCYKALQEGSYFSESFRQAKLFPAFVVHLMHVGEESGKLDEALAEIAEWFEQDAAETVKILTSLMEPVLILSVGLILGFIIIAVLLPVFSINAMIS